MRGRRVWLASLLLLVWANIAQAVFGASYQINRASSKITIDGHVTEAAWKNALRLELKYETSPGENTKPPVKTSCYLTYDDSFFYAACVAEDPQPASVRAHYSDRDNIPRDDYV